MKLYQRLGLGLENVGLEHGLKVLATAKEPPTSDYVAMRQKSELVFAHTLVATEYYLLEDRKSAAKYAAEVVPAVVEHFFGDWRRTSKADGGPHDPMFWKRSEAWMDHFASALGWGSALGDWEGLRKVAEYPDDDCPDDDCPDDGEPSRKALYRAFGSYLLGRPGPQTLKHLEAASRKKSSALAAEALRRVEAKDTKGFERAIADFLKHHRKTKFPLDQLTDAQSRDATFLVHLAEREGLKFDVPEPYQDLLIRL